MMGLPDFRIESYAALLDELRAAGYAFRTVTEYHPESAAEPAIAYLRHDIDFHLLGAEVMASAEAEREIQATYYVPVALPFNVLYRPNQEALRRILDSGHEIGLHYELSDYPVDPSQGRQRLDWEAGVLSAAVGRRVRTVCMHNPHTGLRDPFRDLPNYANPDSAAFRQGCLYVSDSCRLWRDTSLLTCFGASPPRKLLLNTHPELWQDGSVADRMEYLSRVLRNAGVHQFLDYFDGVERMWRLRTLDGTRTGQSDCLPAERRRAAEEPRKEDSSC